MTVEEQAAIAREFVEGVVERFGLEATTEIVIEDAQVLVRVNGDDLGLLVGPRGTTLEALQELTRTVAQRRGEERGTRIYLDVAKYRERRSAALSAFVERIASEVLATGEPRALEPMSAADRKIVHDTAGLIGGLSTSSEGADPHRYVVISPSSGSQSLQEGQEGPPIA